MTLRSATQEENEFIAYVIKTRSNARKKISAILYAERDLIRDGTGNKQNIRSVRGWVERKRAYMRAVEEKLDTESCDRFGVPAFVVVGL